MAKPPRTKRATYKLPTCWLGVPFTRYVQKGKKFVEVVSNHTQEDIQQGCVCTDPRQAFFCMQGHLTECHVGMTCEEARCSHYLRNVGGTT